MEFVNGESASVLNPLTTTSQAQTEAMTPSPNGFRARLNETGFQVKEYDIAHFVEETFHRFGIRSRSVLDIIGK